MQRLLALLLALSLAACSGSGSDNEDSEDNSSDGSSQTTTSGNTSGAGSDTGGGTDTGGTDGASDSGSSVFDIEATPLWEFVGLDFVAGDGTSSNATDGVNGTLVISTSGLNDSNGVYAGSAVTITHSLQGDGEYQLVPTISDLVNTQSEHPNAKLVYFNVVFGTRQSSPEAAVRYQPTSGSLIAVVDARGFYHFATTEPISIALSQSIGEGIEGAPDTAPITLVNIYDIVASP
ncbi:MAG: hypothetical protein KTR35_21035 [Gammaproteobacteria bacterium]|nr:hypothetical protein [Gammaproteobacteria bacterium]